MFQKLPVFQSYTSIGVGKGGRKWRGEDDVMEVGGGWPGDEKGSDGGAYRIGVEQTWFESCFYWLVIVSWPWKSPSRFHFFICPSEKHTYLVGLWSGFVAMWAQFWKCRQYSVFDCDHSIYLPHKGIRASFHLFQGASKDLINNVAWFAFSF